jgi:hypothetical protein
LHPGFAVPQGLPEGAGVRELMDQLELHVSESAGVCL